MACGVGVTLALLTGCTDRSPPPFELLRVKPTIVSNDATTPAVVEGTEFCDSVKIRLNDNEPPTIDRRWDVWVDSVQLQRDQTLRLDSTSLAIVLPAGLPVGTHDLAVTDPRGQSRRLSNALTVVAGGDTTSPNAASGGPSSDSGGTSSPSDGGSSGHTFSSNGGTFAEGGAAGTAGGCTQNCPSACPNGTCEPGESPCTCPSDCQPPSCGTTGSPQLCDAKDTSLVGCYRFESSTQPGRDDSQYGNHATSTGATLVLGRDANAINLGALSRVLVAESPSLDVPHLTIEMWVHLGAVPTGTRAGLLDNDGQYGFFVQKSGALSCSVDTSMGTGTAQTTASVALLVWTHVACTYDGTRVKIYIDAIEQASAPLTGALYTSGTTASSIGANNPTGDNLVGQLDDLRIWNVARTASQICESAQACVP